MYLIRGLKNLSLFNERFSEEQLVVTIGNFDGLHLGHKIIIQDMINFNSEYTWSSFLVSKKFLNSLGLESNLLVKYDNTECAYTGVSIINADKIKDLSLVSENYIILDDKRIAFNLNTKEDYELLNSS